MANNKHTANYGAGMLGDNFLVIPRRVSYMLFHDETSIRQMGSILIALITYAHYADSSKRWKGGYYKCLKGKYIGNYEELSDLTGLNINTIKKVMKELKSSGVVEVKTVRYGCRIILTGYQQFLSELRCVPQPVQPQAPAQPGDFGIRLPDADLVAIAN